MAIIKNVIKIRRDILILVIFNCATCCCGQNFSAENELINSNDFFNEQTRTNDTNRLNSDLETSRSYEYTISSKNNANDRNTVISSYKHLTKDASNKSDSNGIVEDIKGSVNKDPIISKLSSFSGDDRSDAAVWTKFSWVMELFDHHKWGTRHYQNVTSKCSTDMALYLNGLKAGEIWAAKMSDASGRYNGQFFFGNTFWLGSSGLCSELQLDNGPPFATAFSVARLEIAIEEFVLQSRIFLMGICMPAACSAEDVQQMLASGASEAEEQAHARLGPGNDTALQLSVLLVRPVPGDYDMWKDVKFFIVGGAGAVTVVIIIIASIYEGYLNRSKGLSPKVNGVEFQNNNTVNGVGGHHKGQTENGSGNGRSANGTADSENGTSGKDTRENHEGKEQHKKKLGIFSQILLSFSALSNTEKIMNTDDSGEDSINCIHGMRFLSLAWVIMVHTYLQVFAVADNKSLRTVIERNFFYQTVGNASYSVDTFFFISGLLVTFLYYKSLESKRTALSKMSVKLSQNPNAHYVTHSNGERAKIHQYAYANPSMQQHSIVSIGRIPATQPMAGQELIQATNPVFTRQTCSKEVKENSWEFLTLIFYRVVRLTPAYLFVIGINELALKYSHNNSVFEPTIFDHITCDKYWWRNVLYINNLYPQSEMCMVWSWYMANDTQFYVVGIVLLLLSKRHFKLSATILMALLVSSWFTTGYISLANNYKAKIQEPFEMFDELYDKPWSRLGPYLVGMITGWILWKWRGRLILPWWAVLIGWPAALATMASLIYGMKDGHLELWPTAFYVSIGHTAWSVATAWVVVSCVAQRGGLVAKALSYRGVLPLSRLAYCAYLVHPTIMMLSTFQMDGPVHLHNGIVLIIYAGNTVMSYLMSFAISLAFEAPVVRLLKINLAGNKRKDV